MQDEQAHFSPSITGMPRRSRPAAVVAQGYKQPGGVGVSRRTECAETEKTNSVTAEGALWDKDTGMKNRREVMLNQTPVGILVNGMLGRGTVNAGGTGTRDDRVGAESGEWRVESQGVPSARGAGVKRGGSP